MRLGSLIKKCRRLGLGASLAALAIGASMLLAGGATANPVPDPMGDVVEPGERAEADYDIVMARSAVRGHRLVFKVRVAGTPVISDDHTVVGSGIQIELNTERGRPGNCNDRSRDPLGRTEFIITTHGLPRLIDCTATGIPESMPVADLRGENALVLAIDRRHIGNPPRLGWFASSGPFGTTSDLAPDADARGNPVHAVQQLRAPGSSPARWRNCGDPPGFGAGAFNVRALRVGCQRALRLADAYPFSPDAVRRAGWQCRSRQTGYETSVAQCAKRGPQGPHVIRFGFGA